MTCGRNKSRAHRTLVRNQRDSVINAEGVPTAHGALALQHVIPVQHGVSKKKLKQRAVRIKHMKRAAAAAAG